MAKRAGFLDQILPHRVKRSRLWFPRSSAQIQSRGIKRKRACFYTAPSSSWGAKRARTALSGRRWLSACSLPRRLRRGRVPPKALSGPDRCAHLLVGSRRVYSSDFVDLFESDPVSCGGRRRDWASLGDDGPACLIAQLVLANDVADYVRFRAVCRPWRRCSVDPRSEGGLDGRFHPRQWIMLDKALVAGPCCHRFLNVSTGECIRTDLPDLAEHTLHAVTPEGLLLLLHRSTLVVRLLNPLTRRLTDLPPATTLVTEQELSRQGGGELGERLSVYSAGIADASSTTVAIYFRFPMGIAVAKPGDQRWSLVYHRYVDATLSFAGRFYCAIGTSVMVLDNSASDPRLVTAVKRSFGMSRMSDSLHLLDNAGELMLVHRLLVLCKDADAHGERYKMDYRVYRVDLDAGALVPVISLNGRAVFIGRSRAISVSAGAFSSISADTLYLGSDCNEKTTMNKIEAYNVADGSTQPYCHGSCIDIVQPYGVVDCISHCIMDSGGHLV